MPYLQFAAASDNRAARGAVLLRARNVQIERAPAGSGKPAPYYITSTPGFTARYSFGANIRGLYASPGVVGGALFVVAGTTLVRVTSGYSPVAIGTISGSGTALFVGLRDDLVIVANGLMWLYNGSSLTQVTDGDLSSGLATLAALGQRIITSAADTDQLEWSAVLDATSWPADGFATSEINPDPIVANVTVGDELYSLGKVSTQIWRAVGGEDADAFDTFAGQLIDKGCIARDTAVRVDAALMWLGDDRCVYRAVGPDAQRVPNRDLEIALSAMSESDVSACLAFAYTDGSKLFYVLRPPSGVAYAYDVAESVWQERGTFGADAYRYGYYAFAYDKHFVAGPDSDTLYTMEHGVFADGADVLERVFMAHVPAERGAVVRSVGFDVKGYGQPLGLDPVMHVTFYRDGGSVSSIVQGIERRVTLGSQGNWSKRPTLWRFGQAHSDGFLLECRITDAAGAAVHGFWINEGRV